ncbi:MAG: amino acid ABC transporter permease [Acidobacteriota bacterium]
MAVDVKTAAPPARPPAWNDPRVRALFFQALVLAAVIFGGVYLVNNTLENLERQGIASGFGFLNTTAGFSISMTLVEYSEESTYGRAFLVGLLNTLLVSGIGVVFATILGFLIGVARLSRNWLVAKMAAAYVEILRNIPLLLQLFFWYFAVLRALPSPRQSVRLFDTFFLNNRGLHTPSPIFEAGFSLIWIAFLIAVAAMILLARWAHKRQDQTGQQFPVFLTSLAVIVGLPLLAAIVTGFPMSWEYPVLKGFNFRGGVVMIPEFVALVVALSTYTAAFIAEIVRAGILAVSHGQTEAAYALGLKPGHTLRLVIIPQALRVIIPPLTSQYLNLTKNSSLAAAIAYPDIVLVFAGTVLMQTGQAVEIIAITMGTYLVISLLISAFMNWYNKKMALVER